MNKGKKFPTPRRWVPANPQKYVGDVKNIISRSSWERKFMNWCDSHPSVIEWSSETCIIPYISPIDGKQHRYYLDFTVIIRNKEGLVKKYLVEVKPESQTFPPVRGKKREKTYIAEVETWGVNSAKWKAAKHFAQSRNCEFIILTENHLGVK